MHHYLLPTLAAIFVLSGFFGLLLKATINPWHIELWKDNATVGAELVFLISGVFTTLAAIWTYLT